MECRLVGVFSSVCCFAGLAIGPGAANVQNLLTDLGPVPAYAINNSGEVVLSSGVYSNGTVTAFSAGFTGTAINSSGALAGFITDSFGGTSAALYSSGTLTNIGLLLPDQESPGLEFGEALGINASGQVVGWGLGQPDLINFAFIYTTGTATVLPHFPGSVLSPAQAVGINDSGNVVGTMFNSFPTPATNDAFIYNSTTAALADLGPGTAYAINASGHLPNSSCVY